MFNKKSQENQSSQNLAFIVKYFFISLAGFFLAGMAGMLESHDLAIIVLCLAVLTIGYSFYSLAKKGLS